MATKGGQPSAAHASGDGDQPPIVQPVEVPQAQQLAKVPRFWRHAPKLWFDQVELLFARAGIAGDAARGRELLCNIDEDVFRVISRIEAQADLQPSYQAIKQHLLEHFGLSDDEKEERLFRLKIGDMKPSELLQEVRLLLEPDATPARIRKEWARKLPKLVQNFLVGHEGDLYDVARYADNLMSSGRPEYRDTPVVNSVQGDARLINLEQKIVQLTDLIGKLASQAVVKPSQDAGNGRSGFNNGNQRNARRPGLCYYHSRFGERAHKCVAPCSFKPNETKN